MSSLSTCRACGKALETLFSLGNLYVSTFVTDGQKGAMSPLTLAKCVNCSLVQLEDTVPPTELYQNMTYWYQSGISSSMRESLRDVAEKTTGKAKPLVYDIWLDIGCNDGTMFNYVPKYVDKIGFDPANLPKRTEFTLVKDYFTAEGFLKASKGKKAKVITAIAMFYDLPDPNRFVQDVAECLDEEGVFVIQQNYLPTMLKENTYDNICHEHLEYYSYHSLRKLLARHGLHIFDVETNDVNGGSFRTYIGRASKCVSKTTKATMRMAIEESELGLENRQPYDDFAERIYFEAWKLRAFISEKVNEGKTVAVYGASTKGNTILQFCRLDSTLIKFATDANPDKWGLKTVGTNIPIISKEAARIMKPDYFLLMPYFFADEILAQEKEYIADGGRFIIPLPEFRVI